MGSTIIVNGKTIEIKEISRTGFGADSTVKWEMISEKQLNDEEICKVVERCFNSAGYGKSRYSHSVKVQNGYSVTVTSWASCD